MGQKTQLIRIVIGILVIVLAGASVSIAGPIGFIGLIVPHIVKRYISKDYFLMVPLTFLIGADLLLLSDMLSRLITFPYESPVGIVTSFVGAIYSINNFKRGETSMTKRQLSIRYTVVIICLIVSIFVSLCVGSTMYSPLKAIHGILKFDDFILNEYRIPRTLLGLVVGSSLAISGAVIQGVVRNPLASPDVIGITKGASLAAIIVIMLFPSAPLLVLPIGSFIGALFISLILSFLIAKYNIKGSTLALIGLAIGAICTAVVQFLLIRNPMDANNALVWLTGSLYGHTIENFYSIIPWFVITLPLYYV